MLLTSKTVANRQTHGLIGAILELSKAVASRTYAIHLVEAAACDNGSRGTQSTTNARGLRCAIADSHLECGSVDTLRTGLGGLTSRGGQRIVEEKPWSIAPIRRNHDGA